ncbi:MAG: hypothetical protein QM765_10005 [Myxococcales bacterium]
MPPALKDALGRLRAHWSLVLPAFVYLTVFPWLPELRSPNELCRLHQSAALVDHHTFEINQVLQERGWAGDLSCVAVARDEHGAVVERRACPEVRGQPRFREEHFFPSKAPLLSVAAVPVYAALKAVRSPVPENALVFFARLFCTVLPAVLLLVLVRRFLRAQLDERTADALTAAYALGTLAFSYAELFMSHQTAAVLLFTCFYALWRLGRGDWRPRGYVVAGLLAGLTVAAEYTAALGLVPLAAYALWTAPGGKRGKLAATGMAVAGVVPIALLLALYHQAAFGHPLHSGYKYLNDAGYQGWHVGGFLGIKLPDPRAFALSYFSPLRGLFMLSPFLMLALPGLAPKFWTRENRPLLALSVAMLALYTYFTSSFSYDSWGWTTGPRHLTTLVPFLLLPVGLVAIEARRQPLFSGVVAGLVALSILSTCAMTFLDYIPDSLTNALYQVALPFITSGHLPQTWFSLAGVPNPWAAIPLLVAVIATAALVTRALLPADGWKRAAAVAAACALTFALGHSLVRPRDDGARARDEGTYRFLEERYVPRPGQASPPLFP